MAAIFKLLFEKLNEEYVKFGRINQNFKEVRNMYPVIVGPISETFSTQYLKRLGF